LGWVALLPDGKCALFGVDAQTLRLWDLKNFDTGTVLTSQLQIIIAPGRLIVISELDGRVNPPNNIGS